MKTVDYPILDPRARPPIGRYRLPFGYLMAVLVIALAEQPLWWPALALVALGEALRLWSAGCISKKTQLTTTGPYALVRNPLYLGTLISALGLFVFIHNWVLLVVFLVGFAVFYSDAIRFEERLLTELFGDEFAHYKVSMPSLFPNPVHVFRKLGGEFSWRRAWVNEEQYTLVWTFLSVGLTIASAYLKRMF